MTPTLAKDRLFISAPFQARVGFIDRLHGQRHCRKSSILLRIIVPHAAASQKRAVRPLREQKSGDGLCHRRMSFASS